MIQPLKPNILAIFAWAHKGINVDMYVCSFIYFIYCQVALMNDPTYIVKVIWQSQNKCCLNLLENLV